MINVLSLFDGMAGARVALDKLGIECNYYASEIERFDDGKIAGKYAMQIAKKNYPDIIHIGDIRDIKAKDLPQIDLLIGGSPCQDLSCAKSNREGLKGEKSRLFYEFLRLLKECKPRYFLLENVTRMSKESRDMITKLLGVSPIKINSALMTAQNRERYYWMNWLVFQPVDRGIPLKDIILDGVVDRDKSYCIDASYYKGTTFEDYTKTKRRNRQVVFKENIESTGIYTVPRGFNKGGVRVTDKAPAITCNAYEHNNKLVINPIKLGHLGQNKRQDRVYSTEGKSVTLCANGGGWGAKTGLYYTKEGIRTLHPMECERLQGFPDGYSSGISKTQAIRGLGNSFTVPIIVHNLSFIKKDLK